VLLPLVSSLQMKLTIVQRCGVKNRCNLDSRLETSLALNEKPNHYGAIMQSEVHEKTVKIKQGNGGGERLPYSCCTAPPRSMVCEDYTVGRATDARLRGFLSHPQCRPSPGPPPKEGLSRSRVHSSHKIQYGVQSIYRTAHLP
jgi:hypothetical protein